MSDPVRLSLAAVHALVMQVLRAHEVSDAHAEQLLANILVQEGMRLPSDRRYVVRQRTHGRA